MEQNSNFSDKRWSQLLVIWSITRITLTGQHLQYIKNDIAIMANVDSVEKLYI